MALTEQEELELLELEELEAAAGAAQRPSAASEIKAKHAKNVAAGAKAYKPSWTESFQTGYKQGGSAMGLANVVGEAVKGAGEAITSAPETIRGIASGVKEMGSELVDPAAYKSVAENPIVDLPGKIGAGLITGATEPLISPRTTGKALTEAAVPVGVTKGALKGAGAVKQIMQEAPQRALRQGTNQVLAGLRPNPHTAKALENTQGDFNAYMTRTGRQITDSKSGATVFKDATDEFYSTNYQPLVKEIEAVTLEHGGQSVTPSQLLARRAEINDTLGRIGYYDKNPLVQSYARSSPQVQTLLEEAESVRGTLNKAVDAMTPTNAGAANILRKYADMKQVSDMARIRAERVGLTKKIKAGEEVPLGAQAVDLAKDAAVTLGTLGMNPKLINRWVQAVRSYSKKAPDPDVLFKRGAENWKKGSGAAAQPIPIERLPRRIGPGTTRPDASGPITPGPDMPPLPAMGSQFEQQPGGGYRFRDPTQQGLEYGREQNALAPQGYPPLPPEIENMSRSSWLRHSDVPEPQILMDEMIERTTRYPLARSRPGERGSIRLGPAEENAFSPSQNISPQRSQSALKKLEKTFFHGTREEFEGPLRGSQGKDLHQEGIWFAPNRGKDFNESFISDATRYSGDYGKIISAKLKLRNPYLGSVDDISSGKVTAQWLRDNGYDGFIDDMTGSGLVAVLDSSQITETGREILGKANPTGKPLP